MLAFAIGRRLMFLPRLVLDISRNGNSRRHRGHEGIPSWMEVIVPQTRAQRILSPSSYVRYAVLFLLCQNDRKSTVGGESLSWWLMVTWHHCFWTTVNHGAHREKGFSLHGNLKARADYRQDSLRSELSGSNYFPKVSPINTATLKRILNSTHKPLEDISDPNHTWGYNEKPVQANTLGNRSSANARVHFPC